MSAAPKPTHPKSDDTIDNIRAIVSAERLERDESVRELDAAAHRFRAKIERRVADARAAPPKILIVEDNKPFRDVLARIFTRDLGAVVDACSSVDEASQRTQVQGYDLVVVDLHLAEGGDGVEVIRNVRNRSRRPMTKILVVSGVADPTNGREIARRAGAHEYLAKPAENDAFVSAARRLLEIL